jgi:hypothetical protein
MMGMVLNDGDRYSPRSDQDLRETLRVIRIKEQSQVYRVHRDAIKAI